MPAGFAFNAAVPIHQRLAALEAKDKARDAKFAKLEQLLDAAAEVTPVVLELKAAR